MIHTVHPRTRELLTAAGMAPRELDALDQPPIFPSLPNLRKSYGLMGERGVGKSWALAHQVALMVDEAVKRQEDPARARLIWVDGDVARDHRLLWVNWLEQVEDIHRRRFDDVWVDAWSEWAEYVPLLVLDDLGRERFEGDRDPARAVLVRVLDSRYRCKAPVLWASNLKIDRDRKIDEFTPFYGGALASRIFGTWPALELEGQDLRLVHLAEPTEFKRAAGGDQ